MWMAETSQNKSSHDDAGTAFVKTIVIALAMIAQVAPVRAALDWRFRVPARYRSDHHGGHPLRRIEQFRRPAAQGLRGRRMRGETRRRAGAEARPAGTNRPKTVAENAGLLPAGARGRRYRGVGAERQRDNNRASLQSVVRQEGSVPARLYR